jgi:hypothetical protein
MPPMPDNIVPLSDHFDGKRFRNQEYSPLGGLRYLLRWKRTSRPGPWREWTDAPPGPPPPIRVGAGELRVTFINHATVLIQMEGQNILTDPILARSFPVVTLELS